MNKRVIQALLLLTFFISINGVAKRSTFDKFVRGCEGWGFYAEFLWVINHIQYCIVHQKTPVVYWGHPFAYYDPNGYNGSSNCWEYYFEPVSSLSYQEGDGLAKQHWYENFSVIWNYDQYIEHLGLIEADVENKFLKVAPGYFPRGERYPVINHLYNESFRKYIKERIIDKYIHPKKNIVAIIDDFYKKNMAGKKTVGIHLRGHFVWNEVPDVPIATMLAEANKHADGNTQFFIATDQLPLLEEAKKVLKGKVIYYESQRFHHTTSPIAGQAKLHPILGENVVIEMLLLSMCDHFIHTISNVSTTALYFNPTLKHTVFY